MTNSLAFRRECGTCHHWNRWGYYVEGNVNEGRCLLNAPVSPDPQEERAGRQSDGVWPKVMEDDVCGQWYVNLLTLEDRARAAVRAERKHWQFSIRHEREYPDQPEARIPDGALEIET